MSDDKLTPAEKAYDVAYEKMFSFNVSHVVSGSFDYAQTLLQLGHVAGWNGAMLKLNTPESLALVVRCSHGSAIGLEPCVAPEHTQPTPEMMQ